MNRIPSLALVYLLISLLALTAVASPREFQSRAELLAAGEQLKSLGVQEYAILPMSAAKNLTITLFGNENAQIATMSIERVDGGDVDVRYHSASGDEFVLGWHPSRLELTITDQSETVHRIIVNPAERTRTETPGVQVVLDQQAEAMKRIAATLTELEARGIFKRQPRLDRAQTNSCIGLEADCGSSQFNDDPLANNDGGLKPPCLGPEVRGAAYGQFTRSVICNKAKNDASIKCWNRQCIGCCRYLDCDAYCLADDYFCITASVYGWSCGS